MQLYKDLWEYNKNFLEKQKDLAGKKYTELFFIFGNIM